MLRLSAFFLSSHPFFKEVPMKAYLTCLLALALLLSACTPSGEGGQSSSPATDPAPESQEAQITLPSFDALTDEQGGIRLPVIPL